MESFDSKPVLGSGVLDVPKIGKKHEMPAPETLLYCAASFAAGWLFIRMFSPGIECNWPILTLGALLTVWELYAARGKTCEKEHFLWLAGLWSCILYCGCSFHPFSFFGDRHLWDESAFPFLFTLLLTPYWVFACSGLLTENPGSSWAQVDLFCAVIRIPFRNLFLRAKTLLDALASLREKLTDKNRRNLLMGMITCLIAVFFLAAALQLLRCADAGFASLLDKFTWDFRFPDSGYIFIVRFLLSLPVGAYLYGLICGSRKMERAEMEEKKQRIEHQLSKLRCLPVGGWYVALGCFVVLYLFFFVIQGGELLQVLQTRLAPGAQTMSQYAVQGFYELCLLMLLNLTLLDVSGLSAARSICSLPVGRILFMLILGETLLFAVSAATKLWIYFAAFGFTPLRAQAAWAILLLSAACVCEMIRIWTGRRMERWWCRFAGITLILTMLI